MNARKRIFAALLTAALLSLTLAACGGNGEEAASSAPASSASAPAESTESSAGAAGFDEEALAARGAAYLDQFNQGSFDSFYQDVTAEFSGQIPADQFSSQWSLILMQAGPFKETLSSSFREQEGRGILTILSRYARYNLFTTVAFDADGRVSGMGNQFQPLITQPQSTDRWEEVSIQVGYNENKLNGLLTLPKGVEKPPVVILLQGSGPSNMDECVGETPNRPFADIAHGLAEQGVASIRYDKRTYAYPLDAVNAGVEVEYLNDAGEAIRLAAEDDRVDGGRIYLLGHSLGGILAPKIAQDHPEIKGLISLAGTLRHMEDLSLDQNRRGLEENTTLSDEEKQAALAQVEAEVQKVKALDPSDTTSTVLGLPAAYWNSMNAIDGASIVKELDIPMLILQGENDFQVSPEVDYSLWQDTLAGRENAVFHLYPGLSHLFMPGSGDKIDVSIYDAPAQVEPQVIKDIADWVNQLG